MNRLYITSDYESFHVFTTDDAARLHLLTDNCCSYATVYQLEGNEYKPTHAYAAAERCTVCNQRFLAGFGVAAQPRPGELEAEQCSKECAAKLAGFIAERDARNEELRRQGLLNTTEMPQREPPIGEA